MSEAAVATPPVNTPAAPPMKAGDPPPAPASGGNDAPLLSGDHGAEVADGGEQSGAEASWRDDWRDQLVAKLPAAEREKEISRLKRFASPENVFKSLRELERKQSSGQLKAALPENATPEEIATFRKANGLPEKPEGYGLAFPAGLEVSDADKADLGKFSEAMHKAHAPPAVVKAAFDYFAQMRTEAMQKLHENALEKVVASQAEMRAEYGKDYKRNIEMANRFISMHAGENAGDLVNLKLADGTALGNHPAFTRMMVNAGLASADDDALIIPEGGGSAQSMVERYKSIMTNTKATAAEKKEAQDLAVKMEAKGINFAL